MMRAEIWYVFGLAAIALILLRLRPTRHLDLRDPVAISFTLGLFLGACGNLSKQPAIARLIDTSLFPNAAWLQADGLFLLGLCAGTYWVDLMRVPSLREQGWRLLRRWRVVALLATLAWMIAAARLEATSWAAIERGGIDVAGSPLLLSGRLAYLACDVWSLVYLSYHFYQQRRHMRDRFNYIRLTIPWAGITLAASVPVLQVFGMIEVFIRPDLLAAVWPPLWRLISLLQGMVALAIIATFFPPAYKFVSWLDKQVLIHRLWHIRQAMARSRPDLVQGESLKLASVGLIARDPDLWLATLVNEFELAKKLMGQTTYGEIEVPAGGVMPDVARYTLRAEQAQFMRGLTREPAATRKVVGDAYALARWFAAVGRKL
jgi:hypothetical protein